MTAALLVFLLGGIAFAAAVFAGHRRLAYAAVALCAASYAAAVLIVILGVVCA